MTSRKTWLALALVATLALGVAPGQAVAQEDEPVFEPGFGARRGSGECCDQCGWRDGGSGPGFGRRGPGKGLMGVGSPRRQGPPGAGGLHMALRHLDLSESQTAEIKAIFEAEREQVSASHEQMRSLGAELHQQFESDPYNEEAVRERAAALAALRVEMAVLRARQAGQVRSLLTPEQIDQLEQIKEERKAFRGQRHRRFEQRRGPRPMR